MTLVFDFSDPDITTMIGFGPPKHNKDGVWGPHSILTRHASTVHVEPLSCPK